MKIAKTLGGFEAALPERRDHANAASVAPSRLLSLDVMRGFAVIGMIVVNTLATSRDDYGFRPAIAFLAHSRWAGFTFADFVFPAFVFTAGFSIAASLRRRAHLDRQILARIGARTVGLLVLGFVLTNIAWFGQMDRGDWRCLGVLQRIGLCYLATAILFVACGPRLRLFLSAFVLVVYWPLTLIPIAHQATNLLVPGANFVSFVDRMFLGPHVLVAGPAGYDPEGLLSTLPAIAQCLLGAFVGEGLLNSRDVARASQKLAAWGATALCLGFLWSPFFPIVKNIWTSSFVLVSSGLAMLLLSLCYWLLDCRRFRFWGFTILEAFGVNALLAYVVQGMAQLLPAGQDMHALGAASRLTVAPALVANLPVLAFLVLLWLPLEVMRRRRWILKI